MTDLPAPVNISALARQSGLSRTTVRQRLKNGWKPEDLVPVEPIEIRPNFHDVTTPSTPRRSGGGRSWLLALTCLALGLALAGVGLVINATYAANLGRTMDESALLAALGLAVDGGAVILLSVAARLWQARHPLWSLIAFVAWVGFTVPSMIATASFTSTAIGDHAAGRTAVIEQAMDQRSQRAEAVASAKAAGANPIGARGQERGRGGEHAR